jgi:hypothetical protein
VWFLVALVGVEILVTYSRVPSRELYHVSGSGLEGGASRALVFLNFPSALIALALLAVLYERLVTRTLAAVAVGAAALCAAVFWPGMVDQANLDARPVNVIAALGVVLTLGLSIVVFTHGVQASRSMHRSDVGRLAIAVPFVLVSLPWFAADLGFYLNGVPVLRSIFLSGEYSQPTVGVLPHAPAVHHGHHHGMDGLLLVLVALLLSRTLRLLHSHVLRGVLAAYLALMFCYGVANIANDLWIEQVFKRGWTTWQIPNVLEPRVTIAWGIIVLGAATLWLLGRRAQAGAGS